MVIDAGLIGMPEAVRYIAHQSVWLKRHQDDEAWITELENDLSDALHLGLIGAWGRDKPYEIYRYPLRRVEPDEWLKVVPDILDCRLSLVGAHARRRGSRHPVIFDLHFSQRDIRKLWPRLNLIDRYRFVSPWAEYVSAFSPAKKWIRPPPFHRIVTAGIWIIRAAKKAARRIPPAIAHLRLRLAELRRHVTSALRRKAK